MKSKIIALTLTATFVSPSFAHDATQNTVAAGQKQNSAAISNIYYANCTDARSKGAAPIKRGEPGYRKALDRDNDGVACEPYKSTQ